MTDQLDLQMPTAPSQAVDTSRAAGLAASHFRTKLHRRVLATLLGHPEGLTEFELEEHTGLAGNTLRPRLWELEKIGYVRKSTERRRRPGVRQGLGSRVYHLGPNYRATDVSRETDGAAA